MVVLAYSCESRNLQTADVYSYNILILYYIAIVNIIVRMAARCYVLSNEYIIDARALSVYWRVNWLLFVVSVLVQFS